MKSGDRIVWLRSPGRSILEAWKVERIAGVVVGVCRRRVKVLVRLGQTTKLVIVDPDNLICDDEDGGTVSRPDDSL
jgi:hypothetical protein